MKTLICVQTIQQLVKNGQHTFNCPPDCYVVTPEAREVARQLGVKLVDSPADCIAKDFDQGILKCFASIKRANAYSLPTAQLKTTDHGKIGLADIIGTRDCQTLASGVMVLENAFMPWYSDAAEMNVVLEGQLHIRCDEETIVADVGDTVFIPYGRDIVLGTPKFVRFVYVTCQAVSV